MCSDSIVRDWHGKPYYSLDSYCKNMFHHKCYKIALNARMSCPNRDGTLDTRGCIFCSSGGSGDFAVDIAGTSPLSGRGVSFCPEPSQSLRHLHCHQAGLSGAGSTGSACKIKRRISGQIPLDRTGITDNPRRDCPLYPQRLSPVLL